MQAQKMKLCIYTVKNPLVEDWIFLAEGYADAQKIGVSKDQIKRFPKADLDLEFVDLKYNHFTPVLVSISVLQDQLSNDVTLQGLVTLGEHGLYEVRTQKVLNAHSNLTQPIDSMLTVSKNEKSAMKQARSYIDGRCTDLKTEEIAQNIHLTEQLHNNLSKYFFIS